MERKPKKTWWDRVKEDPEEMERYRERYERRRRIRKELVFESDYEREGLGWMLEGAVEA